MVAFDDEDLTLVVVLVLDGCLYCALIDRAARAYRRKARPHPLIRSTVSSKPEPPAMIITAAAPGSQAETERARLKRSGRYRNGQRQAGKGWIA
jgi:hypothetical protein